MSHAWLLPEYFEDILPPYARQVEGLRRRLMDLFESWGYETVCPPLMEYLQSLLTGAAQDLDLKTFKVVDGLSGRMLGVRADITPPVAR
ncbi:MAG: ATP phosphoribosyltransferase regulatory subunit, partial [Thiobacillaceae bacterium]